MFRWGYTDRRLVALAIAGMVLAASVVVGLPQLGPPWVPMLVFLALWLGYLSIVNVGQTFYGFGWEMLLLEARLHRRVPRVERRAAADHDHRR